jgi:hypothetical protein
MRRSRRHWPGAAPTGAGGFPTAGRPALIMGLAAEGGQFHHLPPPLLIRALLVPGSGPSFDGSIRPGHLAGVPLADAHRVEAPFVRPRLDFLPDPSDVCLSTASKDVGPSAEQPVV